VSGVIVGIFALQFVLRLVLPESETTPFETLLRSSALVRILIAVMAVLSAPIVEEVVFRGVLYSGLRSKIGTVATTATVTLLFGAVHYQQYEGAWASLLGLLALSFVLTLIRAVTRSLLPCFVVHLIYNLIGATFILISSWE
jgi:membrane protease YdiL (CAAX protease family)